ncbi:MAG: DNA polymerase III subunit alpha [Parachlamydiales bacterium]
MSWVPLHCHSQYSVLDASAPIEGIAKRAAELGMPACALTDHGNMYGAVDFALACKDVGVKPLIGCEVYVAPGSRHDRVRIPGQKTAHHLVLLAKDRVGYRNLCKLSSIGFLEGFYYHPRIDKEVLREHAKGLVCLSACLSGSVAEAALAGKGLREEVAWYQELFGEDFYLELQRHPMEEEAIEGDGFLQESWLYQQYEEFIEKQERVNSALIEVGRELGVEVVATNDSHYLERSEWKAHEVLLNVQSGEPCEIWETDSQGVRKHRVPNPKRRVYSTHELYFKSPEQMAQLFSDVPEAVSNTLKVAEKCTLELDLKTRHYPVFVAPEREDNEAFLRRLCEAGIEKRYTPERLAKVAEHYPGQDPMEVVRERLERELAVILPKGMGDYLLIVWDFIDWAKRQGIPMGPGRGSGAGSIILYLIGVTDIEPLRFHLFFERFINPERASYPDIDVDICMERRGEVIDYVVGKYGKGNVAQIITFGTMKAKMAIRDVGRVLSIPLAKVNQIAKMVPEDPNMTLERALDLDPDLLRMYEGDPETAEVIDLARQLEGAIRSTGIHAAGVIVSGDPLTEHMPVCTAKESEMAVTQYAMKPAEKVGMLKIDFLGLKTLTCIEKATAAIRETAGVDINPLELPLDDPKAFALLNQGKTLGVFQMESGGMQELARGLHLDRFEEIIAVVSLFRPGPMEMIPSYVNRKHKREPIEYDHPLLRDILEETYGIMVYQEQVMQIAQSMAGYTLAEGDVLRRAMGKKIMEEMASQREKFRKGAVAAGIEESVAVAVFDKMEKFAAYGFNKSHAASYGFLTYVTAYLKANYPREWMAALMTCDRADTGKVAKFIRECQAMKIAPLPPDVNESTDAFVATPAGIRFAMSGIKGVGEGVVEAIIEERVRGGAYKSLGDFIERIDGRKVGKKVIETLAAAGCFDFTGWSRDGLMAAVEPLFEAAQAQQREREAGVISLFSLMKEEKREEREPRVENPSPQERLLFQEKELLGFFLTGHPMDAYREVMGRLSCVPLAQLDALDHNTVARTAFIIETVKTRYTNTTQKKFAILQISNGLESRELPIWSDLYEEVGPLLTENRLCYAVVSVDKRDEVPKLQCRWMADLTQVDEQMIEACDRAYDRAKLQATRFTGRKREEAPVAKPETVAGELRLDLERLRLSHLLRIRDLLREASGEAPLLLQFLSEGRVVGRLAIEASQGAPLTESLLQKLRDIPSLL